MKQLRCMIIEDESLTVIYIEDILEKIGCKVVGSYDNGASAIEAIRTEDPDFVLLDINLKGPLDGIQVGRELARLTHAQIVFITAYCDDDIKDEAKGLAPFAFIKKPFTSQKLENVVKSLDLFYANKLTKKESVVVLAEGLLYDMNQENLIEEDEALKLSKSELKLLKVFVENRNKILTYEQVYHVVFGEKNLDKRTLRVRVYALRKKLPKIVIETITASGYILITPENG